MKAPLLRRSRDDRRKERGITMALVAVAMVAIIGMAMIAIDLVTLFLAREEAQRAADAAALTAARIISVSGITGTASAPSSQMANWALVCGPSGIATQAAQATGGQNSVGSISAQVITVAYAAGTGASSNDCSAISNAAFAVNPLVVVTVQRTGLPTFFSRYWGYGGQSVSATATAEAFNPSASDANNYNGSTAVTPVQPRCVKPWIVPNKDPGNPLGCLPGGCLPLVSQSDGTIQNPGISTSAAAGGAIGESFTLFADCGSTTAPCTVPGPDNPPRANAPTGTQTYNGNPPPGTPNLEYLPGEIASPAVAVPSCAPGSLYGQAVAGCDQSTQYQCGTPIAQGTPPNAIDLSENPGGGTGDTALGLACSLTNQTSVPLVGEDALLTSSYPFQVTAGSANPLKIATGTQITTSNQIVSLPIYDSGGGTLTFVGGTTANVVIVGFLQVFINSIDPSGNISVTVLNVAGCGNGGTVTTNNPVTGSSPVPIRLITPP
jgi:hypothetical protein